MDPIKIEVIKAALSFTVALLTLAVTLPAAGFVGQMFTFSWNVRQKQREFDLNAAHDFHRAYGEFFSIWKLWNFECRTNKPDADDSIRRELFRRASDAEGLVERLIVKLVTERRLTANERQAIGSFRQGYQQLRQSIKHDRKLDWGYSDHGSYLAFKRLAVAVVAITQKPASKSPVDESAAFDALRDITSNRHERSWDQTGQSTG